MANLRAFEVFLAVVDAGSISRAARTLHLTQPAVSHQIGSLERDLGVAVLDRGRHGATLTAAGRAFAHAARAAVDAAVRADAAARGPVALRLVVAQSFTVPFVVPALRDLVDRGVPLPTLSEGSSARTMVEAVRSGEQDVAVVPGPVEAPDLLLRTVGHEEVVVVGFPGTAITLEAVADRPVIGLPVGRGYGQWLAERFARAGLTPEVVATVDSPAAAAALASAGLGTAVVPESAVARAAPRAHLDPPVHRAIVVVARSQDVVDSVASAFEQEGERDAS
jgi:DNA-binding transcriptional LysR family regulator